VEAKSVSASLTTMTEMVLPNDTNTLQNLMGGRLLHMMDIVGAIAAQKHSNQVVVTASVDNVSFAEPIPLGAIVTLKAQVTRAFNSSMEVFIEVWADDIPAQKRIATNKAYFTFVALNRSTNQTVQVPEAIPETPTEQGHFEGALRRRQLRLVLAGRMNPQDATELKSIFGL
jgi:acyl-CoA hydrolase